METQQRPDVIAKQAERLIAALEKNSKVQTALADAIEKMVRLVEKRVQQEKKRR
jgi:hypothetical protein